MDYTKKKLSLLSRKFNKLFKLPFKIKIYLIGAFLLTGIIRFSILFIPFSKLARIAGKYKGESPKKVNNLEKTVINEIAWVVNVICKYTPWKSNCLVKALTAQIILKKRYISSTLYLGVAKDDQNNPIAHAWLRSGVDIITGGSERVIFTEVARFSNYVEGSS